MRGGPVGVRPAVHAAWTAASVWYFLVSQSFQKPTSSPRNGSGNVPRPSPGGPQLLTREFSLLISTTATAGSLAYDKCV